MPATREQVLCNSSTIVIATIMQGASADCRLQGPDDCLPRDLVHFSIRVDAVLAVRKGAPTYRVGDLVEVSGLAVQVEHPELSEDLVPAGNLFVVPAFGRAMTNAEIEALFEGKTYLFALSEHGKAPFGASIWDLRRRHWVDEVLEHASQFGCPEPIK